MMLIKVHFCQLRAGKMILYFKYLFYNSANMCSLLLKCRSEVLCVCPVVVVACSGVKQYEVRAFCTHGEAHGDVKGEREVRGGADDFCSTPSSLTFEPHQCLPMHICSFR